MRTRSHLTPTTQAPPQAAQAPPEDEGMVVEISRDDLQELVAMGVLRSHEVVMVIEGTFNGPGEMERLAAGVQTLMSRRQAARR